ncbi:septal ring lytic transglycosylase RlpA family protein [Bartonella sp. B41]
MLNNKEKFTSIIKLIFQLFSMIAISQLVASCYANKMATFPVKNFSSKEVRTKIVSLPEKDSGGRGKLQAKSVGRTIVGKPYKIKGKWYYPKSDPTYKKIGQASWYGSYFHGRLTANGEVYDMNLLTAAHPTMPLPSYARVTNLENGNSIIVRVNDRGPFMKNRIIDLSKQAAMILGYENAGVANVEVEYLAEAPADYYDSDYLMASYISGNDTPSTLILANALEEKEDTILKGRDVSKKNQGYKEVVEKKSSSILVTLPKIGPVLVQKPISIDQIVSVSNKFIKKDKSKLTVAILKRGVMFSK